ncbi:DMT family transporter [Streptomyces sp. NPDC046215]
MAGPLLVLAYCVINSVKSVVEGALVQELSPEYLAFNEFVIAQLFYLAVCKDKPGLVGAVRRSWPTILVFNVTTTLSWVAVLYALVVFEPVVANSIIVGLVPTITIVMGIRLRSGAKVLRWELVAAAGILASLVYLAMAAWSGESGIGSLSTGEFVFGLLTCLVTAVAVAGNTFCTKHLSQAGMTVGQMMACRFVLLIAVTFGTLLVRDSFSPYSAHNVLTILALSGLGVITSLYLLQQGIVRTEATTVSMLFGTNLLITYAAQLFDPRLERSGATLTGILLLSASMLLGVWARARAAAKPAAAPEPESPQQPQPVGSTEAT